jgi:hypothetical protein
MVGFNVVVAFVSEHQIFQICISVVYLNCWYYANDFLLFIKLFPYIMLLHLETKSIWRNCIAILVDMGCHYVK